MPDDEARVPMPQIGEKSGVEFLVMAAEFAHLPEDVRPVAALDAEARIAHIRAERWVQHAAADRVLACLHEALVQPPRERMENILLVRESGMSKTMLIRKFERQTTVPFDDRAGVLSAFLSSLYAVSVNQARRQGTRFL